MVATKWSLVTGSGQRQEKNVDQNMDMLIYLSSIINRNRRQLLKCSLTVSVTSCCTLCHFICWFCSFCYYYDLNILPEKAQSDLFTSGSLPAFENLRPPCICCFRSASWRMSSLKCVVKCSVFTIIYLTDNKKLRYRRDGAGRQPLTTPFKVIQSQLISVLIESPYATWY